jgi:hypothetical protein
VRESGNISGDIIDSNGSDKYSENTRIHVSHCANHMETKDKKTLIERLVRAYNSFDADGMTILMHPECSFQNISDGQVTASAAGVPQFRELAEKSKALFSSRSQKMTAYKPEVDSVTVDIDYQAVLRVDLPNGPKAGQPLKLKGKSTFLFRNGLIYELVDQS